MEGALKITKAARSTKGPSQETDANSQRGGERDTRHGEKRKDTTYTSFPTQEAPVKAAASIPTHARLSPVQGNSNPVRTGHKEGQKSDHSL